MKTILLAECRNIIVLGNDYVVFSGNYSTLKIFLQNGAWVAQLVEWSTVDFSSDLNSELWD